MLKSKQKFIYINELIEKKNLKDTQVLYYS